jgi:hypothetical protein
VSQLLSRSSGKGSWATSYRCPPLCLRASRVGLPVPAPGAPDVGRSEKLGLDVRGNR